MSPFESPQFKTPEKEKEPFLERHGDWLERIKKGGVMVVGGIIGIELMKYFGVNNSPEIMHLILTGLFATGFVLPIKRDAEKS